MRTNGPDTTLCVNAENCLSL